MLLRERVGGIWVAGEISRFVAHRSGHWYFTLKESKATVSCAMFRGQNRRVDFAPRDGAQVLLHGVPGVYSQQGRYQLVVDSMEERGLGASALALERLRRRLAEEGLFDVGRKRPLPLLPGRIGVITSVDGAALRDVLRVLKRRFAGVEVLVFPAVVQGAAAASSIVDGLSALDSRGLDVLLLVRGGGSREDLAAFDSEEIVRAIASCCTPVVTGIGHEIDTSLADLAADVRAPTPSAAAEIVVRERVELRHRVLSLRVAAARASRHRLERARSRLYASRGARGLGTVPVRVQKAGIHLAEVSRRSERAVRHRLSAAVARLSRARARFAPDNLRARVSQRNARREEVSRRLAAAIARSLQSATARVSAATGTLRALSPLSVLNRGYALVTREVDGVRQIVDDVSHLSHGDMLRVRFRSGAADVSVARIETNEPPEPGRLGTQGKSR
jgi:exodeoxyribonuclease VII large subunit